MTAPTAQRAPTLRLGQLRDLAEGDRIDDFLDNRPEATPFHSRAWLEAVEAATGHRACLLLVEERGRIVGMLPLHRVGSLFGDALISTGFAVGGGVLAETPRTAKLLIAAAEELAGRLACPTVELRGGELPERLAGWTVIQHAHAGFVTPLAADDDAQMLAIPRKQRAEVRKGRKLFAGIRTFPLISLLGAGLSLLRSEFGPLPLVAGLAGLPRSRSSRTARAFRTATSARRPRSRRWRRSCSARWLAQAS